MAKNQNFLPIFVKRLTLFIQQRPTLLNILLKIVKISTNEQSKTQTKFRKIKKFAQATLMMAPYWNFQFTSNRPFAIKWNNWKIRKILSSSINRKFAKIFYSCAAFGNWQKIVWRWRKLQIFLLALGQLKCFKDSRLKASDSLNRQASIFHQ